MIITIASSYGLELAIQQTITDVESDLKISSINNTNNSLDPIRLEADMLENIQNIQSVNKIHPIINKPCIISINNNIEGLILKGVDSLYKTTLIQQSIRDGRYMQSENEILISEKQARKLSLQTGDECILYFLSKKKNVKKRKFMISGIYSMKNEKFNEFYAFTKKESIQKINQWGNLDVSNYEIELYDASEQKDVEQKINSNLTYDLVAQSITSRFPGIFNWINLFKKNMILIIIVMCLICLINMTNTLLILVLERLKMIGTLKSYGCSNYSILKIFLYSSFKISSKGIALGNIVGLTLCLIQQHTHIITLNPKSYFVNHLPIYLDLNFLILINIIIFIVIQISIIIPYYVIKNVSPANILKIK